jgi:hypothetical protein
MNYSGYFSVIIPDNLKKLLSGDILKLRDSVTEFSDFLSKYSETASEVKDRFVDEEDVTSWLDYFSLSFAFPDNKIIVGIKTSNEKMFRDIQQGIVDGRFKLFLRGTAKVSKDDIEGLDKNIVNITIKKVEGYWDGKLHSSSPDVDRILNKKNEEVIETGVVHIDDLPTTQISDNTFYIDVDKNSKNINWINLFDEKILQDYVYECFEKKLFNKKDD